MTERTEQTTQPGFSALSEDLFGLSARAGRTVYDLLRRPATVFTAARTADWQGGRYTPSLRLVVSLVTLFLLLRFFWEAEDGYRFQTAVEQWKQVYLARNFPEAWAEIMAVGMTELMLERWSLAYPFVFLLGHLLIASTLRIWGPKASYVVRLRLYFLVLAPAFIPLFAITLMTPALSPLWINLTSGGYFGLAAIMYLFCVYAGLKPVQPARFARGWRALVFALAAGTMTIFASFLTMYLVLRIPTWWDMVFGM